MNPVVVVFGHLRCQWQSQVSPGHPEGSEPITPVGITGELRYDIATGTIEFPVPYAQASGALCLARETLPAQLFRYQPRREESVLLRREAELWAARYGMLRAICRHWSDALSIAQLMATELGIPWQAATGEPLAMRLIRLVYALDKKSCNDLTGLLAIPSQEVRIAA
jgi:hypothetical protein